MSSRVGWKGCCERQTTRERGTWRRCLQRWTDAAVDARDAARYDSSAAAGPAQPAGAQALTPRPLHHAQRDTEGPTSEMTQKSAWWERRPVRPGPRSRLVLRSVRVTFVLKDESEKEVVAKEGQNLLQVAHQHDVDLEGER